MKAILLRLPDNIIELIDEHVQEGLYTNRSAAIRVTATRYVMEEKERNRRE
jgi:Arc/MetJ-type ribon-helix-helix transcriptional regulator